MNSAVGAVSRLRPKNPGTLFRLPARAKVLSSPKRPERICSTSSPLCKRVAGIDRDMTLTIHLLRPRLRLSGAAPPFNPLNPKLNSICYLLALLGAHHFLHVNRIRVKSLNFRLLVSYIYIYIYIYIYGAPILEVSRSHTTTQHSR